MPDSIHLKLTREEAPALDVLAEHAAEEFFMDAKGKSSFDHHICLETAALSSDKLHRAALGKLPEALNWSHFLTMRDA